MADMTITGWKDGKWKTSVLKMDGELALVLMRMQQGLVGKGTFIPEWFACLKREVRTIN